MQGSRGLVQSVRSQETDGKIGRGGERKKKIIIIIIIISKVRFLATLFRHFCRGHAFTHIKVVEHGVNRTKWSFLKIAQQMPRLFC